MTFSLIIIVVYPNINLNYSQLCAITITSDWTNYMGGNIRQELIFPISATIGLHSGIVSSGVSPINFSMSTDTVTMQIFFRQTYCWSSLVYFSCCVLRIMSSSICLGPLILKNFISSLLRCSLTFRSDDCIANISPEIGHLFSAF